jgi:DNA adenine methylase
MPGEDFDNISSALSGADIRCEDFEETINRSGEGDLIYCDPPYTVHHNMNGFLKYNEDIFSWNDQLRLKRALKRAVGRGAVAMVSNACHESVLDLYDDFGEITRLDRASVISGKSNGRGRYAEVLVRVGW